MVVVVVVACIVHGCNLFSHYCQTAVQTEQASSGESIQRSADYCSNASSHEIVQAKDLLSSRHAPTKRGDSYIKAILHAERKGVAALRSVAEMLRKRAEDSMITIAKYIRDIENASSSFVSS